MNNELFIDITNNETSNKVSKNNINHFNHLNQWLKDKFGERVLKICIDGGFTCPNRDGTKGVNGCIFCGERGSGEHLSPIHIKQQVVNYLNSYKKDRANKFIAYFQNFSNTYGDINLLKKKYDSALISDKIVALAVATRPDCINEEVACLLKSYTNTHFVWVELGFQTANETTGKLINRQYTNSDIINAVNLLNKYDIPVVLHIMIGLPNETFDDLKNTINFINNLNIWGLKIHSTYIIENTGLHQLYLENKYKPLDLDTYIEQACYVISNISKNIVIHRITGDAPKDSLVAPDWNKHKKIVLNGITKYMNNNNLFQGCNLK